MLFLSLLTRLRRSAGAPLGLEGVGGVGGIVGGKGGGGGLGGEHGGVGEVLGRLGLFAASVGVTDLPVCRTRARFSKYNNNSFSCLKAAPNRVAGPLHQRQSRRLSCN